MTEGRTAFRKSSFSDPQANCVEVARGVRSVELRDSKVEFGGPADARIRLRPAAFAAFLRAL
ncbi:DUF397 domain-containing protein [Actinokineospora guangxiensis]|uniref:DUF397 domain-containing protein n=1 Tax=Actinokineospora guangxiensis TaxID=1490288 RepID=A0ABW0EDL8_9PSEU